MHSNPVIPLEGVGDINKLTPLRDRVLIKREPLEGKTSAGIIVTGINKKAAAYKGIVIATGKGIINAEGNVIPIPDIQVGDTVLYPPQRGQVISSRNTENSDYVLLREGEILAIIKE